MGTTPQIWISLRGGLGNQIFQYIFGQYLIQIGFNVVGYVPEYEGETFSRSLLVDKIAKIPLKLFDFSYLDGGLIVDSENLKSITDFIQTSDHSKMLLRGYWQSVDLLQKIDSTALFNIDNFSNPLCAVHVRRLDYGHHGHLAISYYAAALEKLGWPSFVVYTDEPNFSKYFFSKYNNFKGIITPNLINPLSNFVSLSNHVNLIIANSSFSLLAAYFSFAKHHGKVCFPVEWSLIPGVIVSGIDALTGWHKIQTTLISPL